VDGSKKRTSVLHALFGAAIVVAAVSIDRVLGIPPAWGTLQTVGVALGLAVALAGPLLGGRAARASSGLCLAGLATLAGVAGVELLGRAVGHDFGNGEGAFLRIPPYFRQPTVPFGEASFRKRGPEEWTGQVLYTRLEQIRMEPNPYADEPVLTIRYDDQGFRNPPELADWEVAVVGDSFTEAGYLPYEGLYTSVLAEELGVAVKNLGVSMTGSLSHAAYLEHFGLAPSVRHAVFVFFENDPLETSLELDALKRTRETGQRELREIETETSVLRHLYGMLAGDQRRVIRHSHATFGPERIPVSTYFAPKGPDEIEPELFVRIDEGLNLAFAEFARIAAEHGLTPWLVFMPCKARTHHGQLEFTERAEARVRDWEPSDLPEYVGRLAVKHGLRFRDLTPVLRAEAQRSNELLYNSMYDMHLNARGARLVGAALGELLREGWDQPPGPLRPGD
jgi:hypothetical protein